MEATIKIVVKNNKLGFAVESSKSGNELEDTMILVSALRLLAKHYEDKINKKFSIKQ